jgi:SAM-dependent methyltransferase
MAVRPSQNVGFDQIDMPRDLRRYLVWRWHRCEDRAFDARYRIDTGHGDSTYLQQIDTDAARFAVPYEAVQVFMFRRMLSELSLNFRNYVFVDLGSGKGRALFLAAKAGFLEVIGVEFAPEIHKDAIANLAAFTRKDDAGRRIQLVCRDAADYELPAQHLVVFLYNPFFGEVMKAVVANVARFLQEYDQDLVLLYRNPRCAELFDQLSGLRVIASSESYRIYRRRPECSCLLR